MERRGTYQKGRRKITQPVTRVPPESVPDPDPAFLQEVNTAVQKLDKDRLVLRKSTGWLVASLVITSLGGLAYAGSTFFTREHQLDHLRMQLKDTRETVEVLHHKNQKLERRIVELETQVENLQED